jgi:phosphatidylinositol alpha-mannosyltransferase
MRIGMTSYYLPSCSKIGVGYQVHTLANAMVDRGLEVDVHSVCGPSEGARYRTVQHRLEGRGRTFRWAGTVRTVDWTRYDVLHAHGDDYWLFGPGARVARVHVRTLHGSCFDEALHIHGAKERTRMAALGAGEVLASLVADRTVAVSPGTRRWFPWVSTVIPNGVDLGRFHPDASERADHPVVLCVGTWRGRKRGALLADAFLSHVRPALPRAELWFVAEDVPQPSPNGVVALGRVSDDDLARLYRQAWVFCLPSSYEGFGIPYVEAMASGLPVVSTSNPGADFVTRGGLDGTLVTEAGIGPALLSLLTEAPQRASLGEAGLVRSRDFSLDGVVNAYLGLYDEVAREHDTVGR